MNFNGGGKKVIDRMITAYGIKSKVDLCMVLGITKSTLSNRYMRDSFPAEWVIQCALETGTSLQWLVTGDGLPGKSEIKTNLLSIDKLILKEGTLLLDGKFNVDNFFFPIEMKKPSLVFADAKRYLIEYDFNELSNGLWLVDIENEISIKQLEKIPVKRVKVTSEDTAQFFDCAIDDIKVLGKVVLTCK